MISDFIAQLADLDIRLWTEDGNLRFSAAQGAFTPEIKAQVVARKAEIIAFLQDAASYAKQTIQKVEHRESGVLSFPQRRLWFLDQLQDSSDATYNESVAARFLGKLNLEVLQRSLDSILERHEILRSGIVAPDGQPSVVYDDQTQLKLSHTELTASDHQEALLREAIQAEIGKPFELTQPPLVRVLLIKLSAQEHVLVVTTHHILMDRWSLNIFVSELASLYTAYIDGRSNPMPELPIQYGDFAQWQQDWLEGEEKQKQLDYWVNHLKGAPPLLELPIDHVRPPRQSHKGAAMPLSLSADLSLELSALSKKHGVTLFVSLLSAWFVMLSRYSGNNDVVVGSPVAGRLRKELEGLIGFFANMIALRAEMEDNPTFTELLQRVNKIMVGGQDHQELPFDMVVEALGTERQLSYSPLFQVAFVLQNMPSSEVSLPELVMQPLELENQTSKFDLVLFLEETPQGIQGKIEYATDLFEAATIERFLAHYTVLLTSACAQPEQPIRLLTMLTETERRCAWDTWNDTERDFPYQQALYSLFQAQVARDGDAVAVIDANGEYTYREVWQESLKLAGQLRQRGAEPNQLIAVAAEKGVVQVIGVYAVLFAGAAFLPAEPHWPLHRREQVMSIANVDLVITDVVGAEAQWPESLNIIPIQERSEPDAASIENPVVPDPEDIAYVIFTSGSTGTPKGVVIQHAAALNTLYDINDRFSVKEDDRVLGLSSLAFDLSIYDIFGMLGTGGALVLPLQDLVREPSHWATLCREHRVTLWNTVPALLQLLVEHLEVYPEETPQALRQALLSGDWVPLSLPERSRKLMPDFELCSLGGATEASIWSIHYPIGSLSPDWRSVPYGRPLANQTFYVLDEQLDPCPIGVVGRLYIGGVGLAKGYWGDAEKTAERFIVHPANGLRLYHTGDLGRYFDDGKIEFLGREDFQVKVNGYRIELGEIEAALKKHPQVASQVVVAREEQPRVMQLVGYVVPCEGIAIDKDVLRDHLGTYLPGYMVPQIFVFLQELPLTANGKVDRQNLPEPQMEEKSVAHVAPSNPREQLIADVWCELLEKECVSIHDNFFEIGGQSLLATRCVTRVRSIFGVDFSVRSFFEAPSIAGLATLIDKARGRDSGTEIGVISRDQPLHLSHAQKRLWFMYQLEGASSAYNIPAALKMKGKVDADALSKTIRSIEDRHEILRTTFSEQDGAPVVVVSNPGINLDRIDLTHLAVAAQETEVQKVMAEDAQHLFNLNTGPLMRITLISLSTEEHLLLVNMSHIISDAWSVSILIRELLSFYPQHLAGEEAELPELPIQYADYSAWQQERQEQRTQDLAFWTNQLQGIEPLLELPTDRPRPMVANYQGDIYDFAISAPIAESVIQSSRQQGATPFMVCLAAFHALLFRHSGQPDIVVGSPVANRDRREIENLIGFFVNNVVIRGQLNQRQSFTQLVDQVKNNALAAYDHQELPFEQLVEALGVERSLSHAPIFQVMFAWQEAPLPAMELPDLTLEVLPQRSGFTPYDLILNISQDAQGLSASFEYSTSLFDEKTMVRLADQYVRLLEHACAQPETALMGLPMLSPQERSLLVETFNQVEGPLPSQQPMHQILARRANDCPDAAAVIFEDAQLSYQQLNQASNQLANYLLEKGVQPGQAVGLYMPRCLDLAIGFWGTMKVGAAFVPLDPDYPRERLSFMAADASMPLCLTTEDVWTNQNLENVEPLFIESLSLDQQSPEDPAVAVDLDYPAYVLYTSGSTGRPRGSVTPHRALVNFAYTMIDILGLKPDDRFLQFAAISFDVVLEEIMPAWLCGACVVLRPNQMAITAPELNRLLTHYQITGFELTTSLWHNWVQEMEQAGEQPPSCLRFILMGGEMANRECAIAWSRYGIPLYNVYGLTEAAITSLTYRLEPGAPFPGGASSLPIGKQVRNHPSYVLGSHFELLPLGSSGELCIGGLGLSHGYHNLPARTAQKWVPDPFSSEPGSRMMKTGDRVSYLPDGNIVYEGRFDHQVKLRGFRIDLGEVEAALASHELVGEALALIDKSGADSQLVAYFQPQDPQANETTIPILKEYLRGRIPGYMVPGIFMPVLEFPRSPTGKVDRKALPKPIHQSRNFVAPRSPLEEALIEIFSSILELTDIGVEDDFFELGGHSLLATRLVAQIRSEMDVELPLRAVFEKPTVAQLAQAVVAQQLANVGGEDGDALLAALEGMSDEDILLELDGSLDTGA